MAQVAEFLQNPQRGLTEREPTRGDENWGRASLTALSARYRKASDTKRRKTRLTARLFKSRLVPALRSSRRTTLRLDTLTRANCRFRMFSRPRRVQRRKPPCSSVLESEFVAGIYLTAPRCKSPAQRASEKPNTDFEAHLGVASLLGPSVDSSLRLWNDTECTTRTRG